jgi:hypothetical protein
VDSHAPLGASRLPKTHVSAGYFQHQRLKPVTFLSTIFWANLETTSSLFVQCATRIRCNAPDELLSPCTASPRLTDNVGAMWTSHFAPGNRGLLFSASMCAASGNRREKTSPGGTSCPCLFTSTPSREFDPLGTPQLRAQIAAWVLPPESKNRQLIRSRRRI